MNPRRPLLIGPTRVRGAQHVRRESRLALRRLAAFCAALWLGMSCYAPKTTWAAPLAVGGTVYPVPTVTSESGNVLAQLTALPFTSATLAGTLTSFVLNDDPQNPYGPGDLTFVYEIQNLSSSNSIERFTVVNYTGAATDVAASSSLMLGNSTLPGGAVVPTYADRASADVVGFNFSPTPIGEGTIPPGSGSLYLIVRTDATNYSVSSASLIDGSTATVGSYAPSMNPVPEPGTLALVFSAGAAGAMSCLGRRRRRRRLAAAGGADAVY